MNQSGDEALQYSQRDLLEDQANPDPIEQFETWFQEAMQANEHDATAMTLATVDQEGQPSARMVLLKASNQGGFVFYTNYESRKAKELDMTQKAALVFWWGSLERQVRIEGAVEYVSKVESDEYYNSRPLGSRLGAWASPQSKVISGREELEDAYNKTKEECADGDIPRPPFWGGYRVVPHSIEFWQGRANRLHDRLRYTKQEDGRWTIERLAP